MRFTGSVVAVIVVLLAAVGGLVAIDTQTEETGLDEMNETGQAGELVETMTDLDLLGMVLVGLVLLVSGLATVAFIGAIIQTGLASGRSGGGR